jgi:hypothetical protein
VLCACPGVLIVPWNCDEKKDYTRLQSQAVVFATGPPYIGKPEKSSRHSEIDKAKRLGPGRIHFFSPRFILKVKLYVGGIDISW